MIRGMFLQVAPKKRLLAEPLPRTMGAKTSTSRNFSEAAMAPNFAPSDVFSDVWGLFEVGCKVGLFWLATVITGQKTGMDMEKQLHNNI